MNNETNENRNPSFPEPVKRVGNRMVIIKDGIVLIYEGDKLVFRAKSKATTYVQVIRNLSSAFSRVYGKTISQWLNEAMDNVELSDEELETLFDATEEITNTDGNYQKVGNGTEKYYFSRRSNGTQSSADLNALLSAFTVGNNETLFFFDNSSSFKQNSFLWLLNKAYEDGVKNVEIVSFSRSEVETATRSYENALKIIQFINQTAHFNSVKVGGLELTDTVQQSVFLLLTAENEKKWLLIANTKWSKKHMLYFAKLNGEDVKLTKIQELEFRALSRMNKTKKRFIAFLTYLKNKKSN